MTVVFSEHVTLLNDLLQRHEEITGNIERRLLNVQGKDVARTRQVLERAFDACVSDLPRPPRDFARLKEQLAAAHVRDGYEPAFQEAYPDLLAPPALIARACRHWEASRWPGRNGRLTYARNIFAAFVLRQLERLTLRIWDDGVAADRLRQVQGLLDRLNEAAQANVRVRDARWLIQTAQGPLTRHPEPYFRIAAHIAGSLTGPGHIQINRAGAKLAGGHLRSQLRQRALESGRPIDDPDVLSVTRNSNSMDAALLVRDLVPLLRAYGAACAASATGDRLDLADAILQGISADPELFLTRLDLLTPWTMLEEIFIERSADGQARYAPLGDEHLRFVAEYADLIQRHAGALRQDAVQFAPDTGVYSPLGLTYGFCADLMSAMAHEALVAAPVHDLTLEDMFVSRGSLGRQRAQADRWSSMAQGSAVADRIDYSGEWAMTMFHRTLRALDGRAHQTAGPPPGRLTVMREQNPAKPAQDGVVCAQEHLVTSDVNLALASGATAFPKSQILSDRREGRYLASAESGGKWFAISKVVLTTCTSRGTDARIGGVPDAVIDVLRLTCPESLLVGEPPQ